jgi:hypothetical protein
MDVETPAGGRDRTEGFAPEKRRTFHRGTLSRALPRGVVPSPLECWPWKAMTSPKTSYDVIHHCGVLGGS